MALPNYTYDLERSHLVRQTTSRIGKLVVLTAAVSLIVAGCANSPTSDTSANSDEVSTGWVGERPDGGDTLVSGGSLSYATYSAVSSLDPANRQDGGATGGTEMAAIYDLLVRYDHDSGEYVPQLAESLTSNNNDGRWTLTLRQDVTFSDGTPFDADAVVSSINRYLDKKATHAQVWQVSVASTIARDPRTVEFTLNRPWLDFPSLLTTGPGMIVAPSAMAEGQFTPIGAGPFTVQSFASQDELVLAARKDYWGGTPHLDTLRFPAIVESQGKIDALETGEIQAAYIKDFSDSNEAITEGVTGWGYAANMTSVTLINSRPGRAGADEVVRKAITAAIDPDLLNMRVYGGFTSAGSAMFQQWSKWSNGSKESKYDPETARTLLDQAKAGGYDGKLVYVAEGSAAARDGALTYQAMLQDVGFTVELDLTNNINDLVRKMYAEHDFDIGNSGFNVLDEAPFIRLYGNLYSGSSSNPMGFQNDEMDELLLDVQSARNDDDKREALGKMQELVDKTAPFVANGAGRLFIALSDSVHGVNPSQDGIMLFDKAWVSQS